MRFSFFLSQRQISDGSDLYTTSLVSLNIIQHIFFFQEQKKKLCNFVRQQKKKRQPPTEICGKCFLFFLLREQWTREDCWKQKIFEQKKKTSTEISRTGGVERREYVTNLKYWTENVTRVAFEISPKCLLLSATICESVAAPGKYINI